MSTVEVSVGNFVMPKVELGAIVAWYPAGQKTGRRPETGIVTGVSQRTVRVHVFDRGRFDAVRHVDDPKLALNPEQRECGAWDYTDERVAVDRRFNEIILRLESLEAKINGVAMGLEAEIARHDETDRRSENMRGTMNEYWDLHKRATELGVVMEVKRPSKEWLREQIALKEDDDGES